MRIKEENNSVNLEIKMKDNLTQQYSLLKKKVSGQCSGLCELEFIQSQLHSNSSKLEKICKNKLQKIYIHQTIKLTEYFVHPSDECREIAAKTLLKIIPKVTHINTKELILKATLSRLGSGIELGSIEKCEEVKLVYWRLVEAILATSGSCEHFFQGQIDSLKAVVLVNGLEDESRTVNLLAVNSGYYLCLNSIPYLLPNKIKLVNSLLKCLLSRNNNLVLTSLKVLWLISASSESHGDSEVIKYLMGHEDPYLIPINSFYENTPKINFMAILMFHESPSIRFHIYIFIASTIIDSNLSHNMINHLVPMLLSGLFDGDPFIQKFAFHSIEFCGLKHQEKLNSKLRDIEDTCELFNEDFSILDIKTNGARDLSQSISSNFYSYLELKHNSLISIIDTSKSKPIIRPESGSRSFISNSFCNFGNCLFKFTPNIKKEIFKRSLQLLLVCTIYLEEKFIKYISLYFNLLQDSSKKLFRFPQIDERISNMIGIYIEPKIYWDITKNCLMNSYNEEHHSLYFRCLNNMFKGTTMYNYNNEIQEEKNDQINSILIEFLEYNLQNMSSFNFTVQHLSEELLAFLEYTIELCKNKKLELSHNLKQPFCKVIFLYVFLAQPCASKTSIIERIENVLYQILNLHPEFCIEIKIHHNKSDQYEILDLIETFVYKILNLNKISGYSDFNLYYLKGLKLLLKNILLKSERFLKWLDSRSITLSKNGTTKDILKICSFISPEIFLWNQTSLHFKHERSLVYYNFLSEMNPQDCYEQNSAGFKKLIKSVKMLSESIVYIAHIKHINFDFEKIINSWIDCRIVDKLLDIIEKVSLQYHQQVVEGADNNKNNCLQELAFMSIISVYLITDCYFRYHLNLEAFASSSRRLYNMQLRLSNLLFLEDKSYSPMRRVKDINTNSRSWVKSTRSYKQNKPFSLVMVLWLNMIIELPRSIHLFQIGSGCECQSDLLRHLDISKKIIYNSIFSKKRVPKTLIRNLYVTGIKTTSGSCIFEFLDVSSCYELVNFLLQEIVDFKQILITDFLATVNIDEEEYGNEKDNNLKFDQCSELQCIQFEVNSKFFETAEINSEEFELLYCQILYCFIFKLSIKIPGMLKVIMSSLICEGSYNKVEILNTILKTLEKKNIFESSSYFNQRNLNEYF